MNEFELKFHFSFSFLSMEMLVIIISQLLRIVCEFCVGAQDGSQMASF